MSSIITFGVLAFASTAFAYPSYTLAEGNLKLGIFGRQSPPLDTNELFLPSGTSYYTPTGTGGPTGGPTAFPTAGPTGSHSGSPSISIPSSSAPYQNTTFIHSSTLYTPPTTLPTTLPTGIPITSSSSVLLTTSTVYATITSTITSCPPTVTKCPLGNVVTITIPISTTICPVSESKPTVTLIPTPKFTPTTLPTTLPTGIITSSSSILFTTSTVYATITSTITSCPPAVTKCPLGNVVTVTIPISTTICPVSGSNPTVTLIPTPKFTPSTPALPSTKAPEIPVVPVTQASSTKATRTSGVTQTAAPYPYSSISTVTKAPGTIPYASGTGAVLVPVSSIIVETKPLQPGATITPPKIISTGAAGKFGVSTVLTLVVAGVFASVF